MDVSIPKQVKHKVVKIRIRGNPQEIEYVAQQIGLKLDIANDSGNQQRRNFCDRYLDIVLGGYQLIDSETGEILDSGDMPEKSS